MFPTTGSNTKTNAAEQAVQADTDKRRVFGLRRSLASLIVCRSSRRLSVRLNLDVGQFKPKTTMTDPYTLLFIAACTGIIGVVAPIIAEYAKSRFSDHSGKASLQATNAELQKLADAHAKQNEAAQTKIVQLQAKYDERFSREAILAKYTFEEPNGTYFDPVNKIHVCPFCIQQPQQVISSMRDYGHGWQCPVCNKQLPDPKRPEPPRQPQFRPPQRY